VTIQKNRMQPDHESVVVWGLCYDKDQRVGHQPTRAYTARGKFSGLATAPGSGFIAASGPRDEVQLFGSGGGGADECGIVVEQNLQFIHSFPSPPGSTRATSVALSPDGTLVGAAYDNGESRIWNAKTYESVCELHQNPAVVAKFSANGQWFLTAGNDETGNDERGEAVWDAWLIVPGNCQRWKQVMPATKATAVAVSPNIKLLVMGHEGSSAWLLADFRSELRRDEEYLSQPGITAVDFSEDGRYLYTASRDSTVNIWDVEHTGRDSKVKGNGRLVFTLRGQVSPIVSLSWSDDGKTMATFSEDGWILLRNIDPAIFRASVEDLLKMANQ
jgi:WD40 repeat protein